MLTKSIKKLKVWKYLENLGFYPVRFHFKNYYGIGAELKYLNSTITIEEKGNGYMLHGDFKEFSARQLRKQVDTRIQEIEAAFIKGFKQGLIDKVFERYFNPYDYSTNFQIPSYDEGYKIGYETATGDYENGYYAAQAVKCGRSYEIPKDASRLFIIGFNSNLLGYDIYSHF